MEFDWTKTLILINKWTQLYHKDIKSAKIVRKIKKFLEEDNLQQLIHAVIASRLDYCNSILYGTSRENTYKLQKLQNSVAKLVLGKRKRNSASEALWDLHYYNPVNPGCFIYSCYLFMTNLGLRTSRAVNSIFFIRGYFSPKVP